jgi:ferredoxin-type protein NapH
MGPNGKPVRPFVMPETLGGKLNVWRYLLMRRTVQISLLVLFYGTFHWNWAVMERPLLSGNLSASEFLGVIPMADPFAVLQIILTGQLPLQEVLLGSIIILAIVAFLGGRTWCAWVCPINMITDLAAWIRRRIGVNNAFKISLSIRYMVLALTLVLSVLTGVAAFEWISPISMMHRELVFGIGAGWIAVAGVFLFDLFILRNGWCGHLCPLGAFYALVGKVAQVRIAFDAPTCTQCCECVKVCPEPQVLNFKSATQNWMVESGECTNCGRCITVCPEDTLSYDLRKNIKPSHSNESTTTESQQRRAA